MRHRLVGNRLTWIGNMLRSHHDFYIIKAKSAFCHRQSVSGFRLFIHSNRRVPVEGLKIGP